MGQSGKRIAREKGGGGEGLRKSVREGKGRRERKGDKVGKRG